MQACNVTQDEKSMDTFKRMWNKIVHLLGDCEGATLRVLESLAIAVLRATNPPQGNSKYMTTVIIRNISIFYSQLFFIMTKNNFFFACRRYLNPWRLSILTLRASYI